MIVPIDTIRVRSVRISVMLGGVQLLIIMDVRVITYLSITILATSLFTGTLIIVRWSVKNRWRVRI